MNRTHGKHKTSRVLQPTHTEFLTLSSCIFLEVFRSSNNISCEWQCEITHYKRDDIVHLFTRFCLGVYKDAHE